MRWRSLLYELRDDTPCHTVVAALDYTLVRGGPYILAASCENPLLRLTPRATGPQVTL